MHCHVLYKVMNEAWYCKVVGWKLLYEDNELDTKKHENLNLIKFSVRRVSLTNV